MKGLKMAINRKRKSSFERKCLSKSSKRLFRDAPRSIFRIIDKVEKDARKMECVIMTYDVKVKTSKR
jgi:hypothetical protein